jgi:hypothetical protein
MRAFLLATVALSAFALKVLGGPIGLSHEDGLALAPHAPPGAEVVSRFVFPSQRHKLRQMTDSCSLQWSWPVR